MREYDEKTGDIKYRRKRKLNWDYRRIPYIEIKGDKLVGIWPSSSDPRRIYALVIDLDEGSYTCHTNNNRMCSGLRKGICKHLGRFVQLANDKFGRERMSSFDFRQLTADGSARYGWIFADYLDSIRFLSMPATDLHVPEMIYFEG